MTIFFLSVLESMHVFVIGNTLLEQSNFEIVAFSSKNENAWTRVSKNWGVNQRTWDHQIHGTVGFVRNGNPFICGGIYYEINIAKQCREFSFQYYFWEPTSISLIENRLNAKGILLDNGTFIVMGGMNRSNDALNSVEILHHDEFSQGPNMPISTSEHCVVKKGTFLILSGGHNGENVIDRSFIFNSNNGEWDYPASMAMPRFGHVCGLVNYEEIVVAGGKFAFHARDILDSCELLSLSSFHWSNMANLPNGVFGAATVPLESTFLVIGDGDGKIIYQFDESNYKWSTRKERMVFVRFGHSAFEYPGAYSAQPWWIIIHQSF